MMNVKKAAALIAAIAVAATAAVSTVSAAGETAAPAARAASVSQYKGKTPKYIFMFIGDGMSYPQIQASAD